MHLEDTAASAAESLRRAGTHWAVVLDDQDDLHGWVSVDRLSGGLVSDHARRMAAWVPVEASLKDAFAQMLQEDAGWIAVLDGNTFLGVLTPSTLHEALRRSIEAEALSIDPEPSRSDPSPPPAEPRRAGPERRVEGEGQPAMPRRSSSSSGVGSGRRSARSSRSDPMIDDDSAAGARQAPEEHALSEVGREIGRDVGRVPEIGAGHRGRPPANQRPRGPRAAPRPRAVPAWCPAGARDEPSCGARCR